VTELRLTGKSLDGAHLNLTDGENGQYTLRIGDSLRASVNESRLAAVPSNEVQSISAREIQARLRAGEPIETLAREADTSIEKIERFAGPILQERTYIIGLAQDVVMRKESGREPVTFLEVVTGHLAPRRVDLEAVEWTTWRVEDGSWIIRVNYPNRDGGGLADWSFDFLRRALAPLNDAARWIVGEENTAQRPATHGLVYGNHPAARSSESRPLDGREGPRLVSIREIPEDNGAKDRGSGRAKVPSWDEIMFGSSKKNDDDTDF
jgi:hypothetical protein